MSSPPLARPSLPATRAWLNALWLLVAVFLVACDGDSPDASPIEGSTAASASTSTSTPAPPVPLAVALDVRDPAEASTLARMLTDAGFAVDPTGATRVSDRSEAEEAEGAEVTIQSYALIVHPRHPIYDLTWADAEQILAGDGDLGHQLRVSDQTQAWLERGYASEGRIASALESASVVLEVATTPGLVGLVPASVLDPTVRALTVDGHDPYRDPWATSPLRDVRIVSGPHAESVVAALGWDTGLPDPVGLLATGELIPARCVASRVAGLERGYDASYDGTRDLISAADLAMAHWEPAIVDDTPTPCTPTFNLSTVPEAAVAAASAGIDVALAVGNHVGDCWTGCSYVTAVQQTVAHLRDAGLVVAGAGDTIDEAREPAIVTVDGITFAFLGYDDIAWQHYGARSDTPGTAHADLDGLADDVQAAAALADHVIVGFSWGIEYVSEPSTRQREVARTAIEAGASLVVGNHPHWVQATEWIEDGFVAYSLGNFIYDQDWSVETTQGAVLEIGFTTHRILGVRFRPTAIRQQHLVELVDPAGTEGVAILDQIWRATDAIAR